MAVITISRQMESLGTEIAREVSSRLQYSYLDRGEIEKGLAAFGLGAPEVEKFDEKKPPFWVNWQKQGQRYLHAMEMVICEAASRGNAVIVGRGGQVLLKGIPGVLHVRLFSPLQDRLQRFTAKGGGNEKELLQILKQSDLDSAGFIQGFMGADWENEELYDLTINTGSLAVDVAIELILRAVPAIEARKDDGRSREQLEDRILEIKVEDVLLVSNPRNIRIAVASGVVTLYGSVSSSLESQNYTNVVSRIEGVKKVINNMVILPTSRFK